MDTDRLRELIARRLLEGLPPHEQDELDRALEQFGSEGRAVDQMIREVVGSVGLAATPRKPPEALRERILAGLPPSAGAAPESRAAIDDPGRARSPSRRLMPWLAAAATLAAIGLGLYSVDLRGDLDRTRTELRTAEGRAADADVLRDSLANLVQDVRSLVNSEAVTLSGTSPEVVARARVFVDVDTGRTLLLVDDLPVLPPDQVYQLWTIRDGQPTDAGAFRLPQPGPAWIELERTAGISEADLLAVTVERAPGAPAPTSDPILAGEL